jgi:hypothetical protein
MARRGRWQMVQTGGTPAYIRDCFRLAVVLVSDLPAKDLCGALTTVNGLSLAMYAENAQAALLARVLERLSGAVDMGYRAAYRLESGRTRTAIVQGHIRVADGRSDPALFGGHPRLLQDLRRMERGELQDPIQIKRLREFKEAGVDVVEFPTSPAVDMRFGLNMAQPVVIFQDRFRNAEASERVSVQWL